MQVIEEIIDLLISPTITLALVGGIGYLARDIISNYFASRLDLKIKSDLAALESRLRESEASSQTFRQFALANLGKNEDLLIERRIRAAEAVWTDAVSLQKHRYLVEFLKVLNVEELEKDIHRKDYQEFINNLTPNLAPDKLKLEFSSATHRPFLSPLAWASFSAYVAIYSIPLIVFVTLRSGMKIGSSINKGDYGRIIAPIVPEALEDVRENGVLRVLHYIDKVEELLLAELKESISGKESSDEANKRARAIIEAVEAARASSTPTSSR